MKKYIPLTILAILVLLISIAIKNISKTQFDNTTDSKKASDNQEKYSANNEEYGYVNFVEIDINLPDFIIPNLFDKKTFFTKKDLLGKYTILNFFASWCSTCLSEHDILLRIKKENSIDLYGIAWRDIDKNTKNFLQKNGNPFLKTATDSKGIFHNIGGIEAVPETWLINPDGKIVLRLKGNLQEFSIDEIKNYINLHK